MIKTEFGYKQCFDTNQFQTKHNQIGWCAQRSEVIQGMDTNKVNTQHVQMGIAHLEVDSDKVKIDVVDVYQMDNIDQEPNSGLDLCGSHSKW